jgi:hypothetical protein
MGQARLMSESLLLPKAGKRVGDLQGGTFGTFI